MTQRLNYAKASPEGFKAMRQLQAHVDGCGLEHPLLELVKMRASQINGCAYCLGLHAESLRQQGETQARLDALAGWQASELFSPGERAALHWAEALTGISSSHAADADYQPLTAHFDDREISDLSMAIALMNALNRIAVGMRQ